MAHLSETPLAALSCGSMIVTECLFPTLKAYEGGARRDWDMSIHSASAMYTVSAIYVYVRTYLCPLCSPVGEMWQWRSANYKQKEYYNIT